MKPTFILITALLLSQLAALTHNADSAPPPMRT
jgi:hypothetical protein